jgi:hypothetical protein
MPTANLNVEDYISIAGAALGLGGSLVLAYALDPLLGMIRVHLTAIDTTVQASLSGGNVPVFVGFDDQHERNFKRAGDQVKIGGWMLASAFMAQVVAAAVW